jgi:hypothetical protein
MFRIARTCLLALPAVVGLAVVACSSSTTRSSYDPNAGSSSGTSGASGASGNSSGFVTGTDAGANTIGCSDAAKLVYVLSIEGDLYSFAPAAKTFTKIGPLNCQSGGKTFMPISMAVDRNAVAWVNMRDADPFSTDPNDLMFKVDTKTAACTLSNIKGQMGGMGFSLDKGTVDQETLFVIGAGSTPVTGGLNRVDFAKEQLVPVADLGEQVDLELTGTGDARLFGFLQSSPTLGLAEVDKTTAAFTNKVSLAQVQKPLAPMFAFSFWGGDFYFYTATSQSASKSTTVSRYRPSDKSMDASYMTNIGFHIVGAGVSTCAPTTAVN